MNIGKTNYLKHQSSQIHSSVICLVLQKEENRDLGSALKVSVSDIWIHMLLASLGQLHMRKLIVKNSVCKSQLRH